MVVLFVLGVAAILTVVHRIVMATSVVRSEGRRSWWAWALDRPMIPDTVPLEWVDAYRADPE